MKEERRQSITSVVLEQLHVWTPSQQTSEQNARWQQASWCWILLAGGGDKY